MKMKKIITVLLLSCTLFCLSQHQKGDITISISASPLTTETNSDIGIIGKALIEGLCEHCRVNGASNFK